MELREPTVFFDTTSSDSDSSWIVDNRSVRFILFGAEASGFDGSGSSSSSAGTLDFTERERDEVERGFLDTAEDAVKE